VNACSYFLCLTKKEKNDQINLLFLPEYCMILYVKKVIIMEVENEENSCSNTDSFMFIIN